MWGLLQPGFVRWAPPPPLHMTTLTTAITDSASMGGLRRARSVCVSLSSLSAFSFPKWYWREKYYLSLTWCLCNRSNLRLVSCIVYGEHRTANVYYYECRQHCQYYYHCVHFNHLSSAPAPRITLCHTRSRKLFESKIFENICF